MIDSRGNVRRPVWPADAQPCVWMSAGIVSYKLCDRRLDCDTCPLDAALRGEETSQPETARELQRPALDLPNDRAYGSGHTWLSADSSTARVGVDAFAAHLIGSIARIEVREPGEVARGDVLAEASTRIGPVPLRTPVAGQYVRPNERLLSEPNLLLSAPYGDGWVGELESIDPANTSLMTPEQGRERFRVDTRWFRRRVALHLLSHADEIGPVMADGGERLTDLALMLGRQHYLELVLQLLS